MSRLSLKTKSCRSFIYVHSPLIRIILLFHRRPAGGDGVAIIAGKIIYIISDSAGRRNGTIII